MNKSAWATTVLVAVLSFGCGGDDPSAELPVHLVEGQVMVDGVPQSGVLVELHPVSANPASIKDLIATGKTDASGAFQISTYTANDGAPAGDYLATFRWMSNESPGATQADAALAGEPHFDHFQDRYSDPASSTWRITINSGKNTLDPFHLMK